MKICYKVCFQNNSCMNHDKVIIIGIFSLLISSSRNKLMELMTLSLQMTSITLAVSNRISLSLAISGLFFVDLLIFIDFMILESFLSDL